MIVGAVNRMILEGGLGTACEVKKKDNEDGMDKHSHGNNTPDKDSVLVLTNKTYSQDAAAFV